MAGGEKKFIFNNKSLLDTGEQLNRVQIGIVASVDDPDSLGRIKVAINGPAHKGGDDGTALADLPWCYPMVPKFFSSTPKVGEGAFILILNDKKTHADRLYFGPVISQLSNLNYDSINSTALSSFSFAITNPLSNFDTIPALKGIFPKVDDIALQGRYNTDVILRKNEILIRAGKFVESQPSDVNPFSFQFNDTTQGYFHIRNNIYLEQLDINNTNKEKGSVVNIVGNKINLLTHANGTPRFDLMNQENQISDEVILEILQKAHPLPFGDLLIEYLKLLKNALLNHVHNAYGQAPPTDLISGGNGVLNVAEFKKKSSDLENRMLSKNIRIN